MPVGLAPLQELPLAEPLDDPGVGLLLRQPGQLAGLVVHAAVGPDHHRLRQSVVAPDLEVERVVAGRHLQRARPELRVDALVGDHRHRALDERHEHLPSDCVPPAIVVGVHGDGNVGEDRRRPRGRDRHPARGAVGERVQRVGQSVVHLLVHELEVGERRLVERAPVDDPVRPVDPPPAVEVHEEAHHRAHVLVVHREALAPVVHRGAHAPELPHDRAAVLAQPVPDHLHERLAAELLPGLALGRQVLLDRVLRRDARVVVPGQERGLEAAHPVPADERVGQRDLQRMARVQRAGHVRGRMGDDEGLAPATGLGAVEAFVLPGALPALLDPLRVVQRLHQRMVSPRR